jgi:hypothetical protein
LENYYGKRKKARRPGNGKTDGAKKTASTARLMSRRRRRSGVDSHVLDQEPALTTNDLVRSWQRRQHRQQASTVATLRSLFDIFRRLDAAGNLKGISLS